MTTKQLEIQTIENRVHLAKMTMRLFEHWQLPAEDQLSMLGLSTRDRAVLSRYRSGGPLVSNRDLMDRVDILLGIHKSLRLLYRNNRNLAYKWMTQHNRAFKGMTPVEAVKEWGFAGLLMVRAYLNNALTQ